MGEETFFHSSQEHQRKLKPFRAVKCHHLNTVLMRVALTFTSFQRGMTQEFIE